MPLECRTTISSTIACFQSGWDIASCIVCGTETEYKVETKESMRKINDDKSENYN